VGFLFQLQTTTVEMLRHASITWRDWIFPACCSGCGKVDALFCNQCIAQIIPDTTIITIDGNDAFASVGVHTGPFRKAIHDFKYNNRTNLQQVLGSLLAATIHKQKWSFDLIIPVPLHSTRHKQRGYNQANILATVAATILESTTLPHVLHRTRNTAPQVGKNTLERLSNVHAAFTVPPGQHPLIHNQRILLIDDVCTTGATLAACAEALRHAGASCVFAATLSHARFTGINTGR